MLAWIEGVNGMIDSSMFFIVEFLSAEEYSECDRDMT